MEGGNRKEKKKKERSVIISRKPVPKNYIVFISSMIMKFLKTSFFHLLPSYKKITINRLSIKTRKKSLYYQK